jgi:uncharacterized protein
MRKSNKEITDRTIIDSIIRESRVCRLGLSDNGQPYVVPLSFGYDGKALYFHCAKEGRKLDIIRRNNRICIEFDSILSMVESDRGCGWSVRYRSVIGFGTASLIEGEDERKAALDILMAHYSDREYSYDEKSLGLTALVRIDIETLTGKQSI